MLVMMWCANFFIFEHFMGIMMINKIQPGIAFSRINFKGDFKKTSYDEWAFDDDFKKFSKMQRNYYNFECGKNLYEKNDLNVVFPVNSDDDTCLRVLRSNIKKLKPKEQILTFRFPKYTIDEAISSDKGFTDGICDCIVVLLYNDKKAHLYHLCPRNYQDKKEIEKMQDVLKKSIKDLNTNNKDCKAFLYGGIRGISDNLYNDISKVLDENNISKQEAVFSRDERIGHSLYFDVKKGIILADDIFAYHSKQQLDENFEKVNLKNYFYSEII